MRKTWNVAAWAGLICQSAILAAEPTIYFQENFRNYRETAPLAAERANVRVDNDPIWSQQAEAVFRPVESGLMFERYLPATAPAAEVRAFDVLFSFRFQGADTQQFQLRLRSSVGEQVGEAILTFTPTGVKITSEGLSPAVSGEGQFDQSIPSGRWRQAAVTVKDGMLRVLVADEQRALRPVAEAKAPGLGMGGINFYGFKDQPFAITQIIVRDAAPLPDNSITRLLTTVPVDDSGYQTGAQQANVTIPANDLFGATVRTGLEKDAVKMTIARSDGADIVATFNVLPIKGRFNANDSGRRKAEDGELPDAIIQIKGLTGKGQIDYYVRPRLRRYFTSYSYTDTYHDIIRDWELLPKASAWPVKVELRRTQQGADVYLNGLFAAAVEGTVREVRFDLAPSASIKDVFSTESKIDAGKYLPLDVAAQRMARSFAEAKPSLQPGEATIEGIPLRVTDGAGSADIGLTRQGQGNWALEVDEYLARSPFDGLLTEVHFAVPAAPYHRAWVLAAVDPDPAKDPILTTRLTHYLENGIGNNRLADTTLRLPRAGEQPGPGITPVGTVKHGSTEVPLYLVEVPLPTGRILDLVNESSLLNFEFFGKPWENFQQLDNRSKPDPDSTSAVQVFGVTLEKAPVTMEMAQAQPGNIFHNDEQRTTGVVVRSLAPARGKLAWEIRDVDGKAVGQGSADYSFAAAGQQRKIDIPLDQPQLGWYELLIHLQDERGQTLMTHPARFALLGQDQRQARYDSPYGTWWFDGAHITPSSLDFAGPIMFKAGIRKAAWTKLSEAEMAEYFITQDQVNMPFRFDDLKDPEKAKANAKKKMDEQLAKYPHLREVLVFHESGPGNDVPLELFGVKPEMTEALVRREKRYADLYNLAGAFFRENYPQIKLVVGNNSAAQAVVAAVFRHGGDPQYMDYIGIESPSQVFIPEKLQEWALQGHHIASDTAEVLTGKRIPATGCYEFTYRCERDMGEQQQAEWYARDALISLGNGFTRIGTGILFDASNSYYNGLWGGSGILQRAPWGYPKKSYVAYAVLTNVLDQVKLRRQVPTGSATVYALEFDRSDKKIVSALWAARGQVEFVLQYEGDAAVEVVDMYGRRQTLKADGGKVSVTGGTGPTYVIADQPVSAITLGQRSFPKDEARAALATVAAPLDSADAITLVEDNSLDTPLVAPVQLPVRKAGKFELRQVNDEQKGAAIELQLDPSANPGISKYVTEYATLRLKEPAPVEGEPAALGVWVKGDSNWGRVMFEIQDAEGEVWRSVGTAGWGCDILDWPGNLAVNFDGWSFVALPLHDTALFNDHSPGPVLEQWVSSGGNKRIDFPIQVTGLIVEMNRTPLELIEFKPAPTTIRLKDLGGIAEPEAPEVAAR